MTRLIDSLMLVETCSNVAIRHLGERSMAGQRLRSALRNLRRDVGGRALHDLATEFDPNADFRAILKAALAAGQGWQDLADVFNEVRQSDPRGL